MMWWRRHWFRFSNLFVKHRPSKCWSNLYSAFSIQLYTKCHFADVKTTMICAAALAWPIYTGALLTYVISSMIDCTLTAVVFADIKAYRYFTAPGSSWMAHVYFLWNGANGREKYKRMLLWYYSAFCFPLHSCLSACLQCYNFVPNKR